MPDTDTSLDDDAHALIQQRADAQQAADQFDTSPIPAGSGDDGAGDDPLDIEVPDRPAPAADDGESPRDRLRKSLSNLLDDEDDTPAEPEPETPPAVEQVDLDTPAEEPAEDDGLPDLPDLEEPEPQETEEPAASQDDPATPEDARERYEGNVDPEEWKSYPAAAQKRVNHLRRELREARRGAAEVDNLKPYADYGQSVGKYLADHGLEDEDFTQILQLGSTIKRGLTDPQAREQAIQQLVGTAQNLGYELPKAPVKPDAELTELAAQYGLPDDVVQKLAERGQPEAPAQPPAAPPQQPAPTQPAAAPVRPQPAPAADSDMAPYNDVLRERIARAREKYGETDFNALWPTIKREMLAGTAGDAGIDPSQWGLHFDKATKIAVLERRGKSKPAKPDTGAIDPSGSSAPATDDSKLSPRERLHKRNRAGKLGG